MYIIEGHEAANKLKENYIVLELETLDKPTGPVTAFCIIDAQSIPIMDITIIDYYKSLHEEFITAYKNKDYTTCLDKMAHLRGAFNGQLDSFYQVITERITHR